MSKFEGFADEVKADSGHRGGCAMGELLNSLSDSDRSHVQAALDDRRLSTRAIADALRKRIGEDAPSNFTIGHHRRRACACRGVELK